MADIAESEDSSLLFSLDHRVHVSFLNDVRTDDLSTSTTEDNGQQRADLNDSVADDRGLKFSIEIEFLLCGCLWVLGHQHQFLHHSFDRLDQQRVNIVGEELQQKDENEANEQGLGERKVSSDFVLFTLVENGSQ